MGSALSTFNDFVNTTGPSYLTSAEEVVNEAVKNNYLLRRFLRGKGPSEIVQGGSTIKDTILFDESSTFQFYQPNETFTWTNPQTLTDWEINWRFSVDHMSYTDHEIELNVGGGLGRSARHHMFKRLKRTKEQRLWTSLLNGMETHLFKLPDNAEMETNTGTEPYSIPTFVNERANGLYDGFSTVQGIDPTTDTKWVPQKQTYTSASVATTSTPGEANIISAFDDMYLDVKFVPPPTHQEYFENPALNAQFIACSKKGQTIYAQLLRASQDTFVTASRQDPSYMKPQFAGIDLEYVSELDTAAIYDEDDNDTFTTEGADAGFKGPRYYWINANYMKPVFHTTRYMYMHKTMVHPNQPFTTIVPVDCWYNLVCRSRQRQGIVSPVGNIYDY